MSDLQSTDPLALLYPNQSKETVDKLRIGMEARARQEVQPLIKKLQDAEQKQRDNELKTERNRVTINAYSMVAEWLRTTPTNKDKFFSLEQLKLDAVPPMIDLMDNTLNGEPVVTKEMINNFTNYIDTLADYGGLPKTNQDITSSVIMNSGQVDVALNRFGEATSEEELNMLFADSMESLAILSKELKESDYKIIQKRLEARRDFQKARLTETTANLTSEWKETLWQNAGFLIRHIASIIPNYNSVAGQQMFQHLLRNAPQTLARKNPEYWKPLIGEVSVRKLPMPIDPVTGRRQFPGVTPEEAKKFEAKEIAVAEANWEKRVDQLFSVFNTEDVVTDFYSIIDNTIKMSDEYITELEAGNKAISYSENLQYYMSGITAGVADEGSLYSRFSLSVLEHYESLATVIKATAVDGRLPDDLAEILGLDVGKQEQYAIIALLVARDKITKDGATTLRAMVDTAVARVTLDMEKYAEELRAGSFIAENRKVIIEKINNRISGFRKESAKFPDELDQYAGVIARFSRMATSALEEIITNQDPEMPGQTESIASTQLTVIKTALEAQLKEVAKLKDNPEEAIALYENIDAKLKNQFGNDTGILEPIRRLLFDHTITLTPQLTIGKKGEVNYFGGRPFLRPSVTHDEVIRLNTGEFFLIK